jgi:O-antigen biosynthesis protein
MPETAERTFGGHPTDVSAVISTHNRSDELARTLGMLVPRLSAGLEVVVVDNASTDNTRKMLRERFPSVRLVPHSWNRPLHGYNIGFQAARASYVLALHDDACPRAGVLEKMRQTLESEPLVAAAAGNIVPPTPRSAGGGDVCSAKGSDASYTLSGCGFLARRDVLLRAGGYNESLDLCYSDLDLALRLLALGYRIVCRPEWTVEHRNEAAGPLSHAQARLRLRNFARLVRSHFSGLAALDLLLGHALRVLRSSPGTVLSPSALGSLLRGVSAVFGRSRNCSLRGDALRGFVRDYALSGHLRARRGLMPSDPGWDYPSFWQRAVDGASTVAPSEIRPPKAPRRPVRTACYWESRVRTGDFGALQDFRAMRRRFLFDRLQGCRCTSLFKYYISPWEEYQKHLAGTAVPWCCRRRESLAEMKHWTYRPRISVLLPVHRVALRSLDDRLQSVAAQSYPDWELCCVEDASGVPAIRRMLQKFAALHPQRVKLVLRDENWGIARTSQQALELATGEYIALLDHDDRLEPQAFFEVAKELNANPAWDWIYSDYDKLSPQGERYFYYFKPDWSPDLFFSYCYVLHLSVIRRELALEVGGFRAGFEGSQDYDLYLRIADRTNRVFHIPKVLYSWRQSAGSTSLNPASKPYSYEAARRALEDTLRRRQQPGTCEVVTGAWDGIYRIRREAKTEEVDLVVLGDPSAADACQAVWQAQAGSVRIRRRTVMQAGETGGATLARALASAESAALLVTCAGATPASKRTLHDMVCALSDPGVGAIGAKVITRDGRVDHCGLAVAVSGQLFFPLRGLPAADPCYGAFGFIARNVSCLSPVATLLDTAGLRRAGGVDTAMEGPGALVGACLALREAGFRIVVDGGLHVVLDPAPFEPGPALAPGGADLGRLLRSYAGWLVGGDPFYNRNHRQDPPDFGVRTDVFVCR